MYKGLENPIVDVCFVALIATKSRVIGLLGGSFNPAHGGHLHITEYALKHFGLDEVWWLVSPKNPLKDAQSLAGYEQRLHSARDVAKGNRRIRVMDIERRLRTKYTYQTLAALKSRYPSVTFVWMMGADNLAQFHRWRRWRSILAMVPVMVFDRAPYSHRALRSRGALYSRRFWLKTIDIGEGLPARGLCYIHLRRDPRSSTGIRKQLGRPDNLGHNKGVGAI